MHEQENPPELRKFWTAERIDDHNLLGVEVKIFLRATGDSVLQVGDHVLGLVATESIQTTRIDGAPPREFFWPANSIGFLPAGMRAESRLSNPTDLTILRMSRRYFDHTAFEPIEPDRGTYRYLHGLTDKTGVHLCGAIRALAANGEEHEWPLLLDTIATGIAVRTMQLLGAQLTAKGTDPSVLPSPRLRRVLEYIEAHLDRIIRLPELASAAALSTYHFSRAFRASTGLTPMRYVWHRRVERAKLLMRQPGLPLATIAFDCGFSSQSHFTGVFKRETGLTPTEYRAKL